MGLLREQFRAWPEVDISSAGTAAPAGAPPTPEAVAAAAELGADIRRHRSRPVSGDILARARLVITMTMGQARELQSAYPLHREKIMTLGELSGQTPPPEVADPIGQSLRTYRETAGQIQKLLVQAGARIRRYIQ